MKFVTNTEENCRLVMAKYGMPVNGFHLGSIQEGFGQKVGV